MRRTGRAVANLGWRGMLALVGGVLSLTGVGATSCMPPYGTNPVRPCKDSDCAARFDSTWHCDEMGGCTDGVIPDAGAPDSGS